MTTFTKITRRPIVLHGLPITPAHLLEQLAGESFCVSFADPRQIERAIALQDPAGMLMLDNGAFSHWRSGQGKIDAPAFFAWANDVQARSAAAVAVVPDVIQGSELENWAEASRALELSAYPDRLMFVWHMNDSLDQLARAAQTFRFIAFGSCAEYDVQRQRKAYLARVEQARKVIDAAAELTGSRCWVHLMRGTACVTEILWVQSTDSTNVARNHCRTKGQPEHVRAFADRIQDGVDDAHVDQVRQEVKAGLYPRERWLHALETGLIRHPGDRQAARAELKAAA
jgi:hypothetical protein